MNTCTKKSNTSYLPKYLAAAGITLLLMTPLTASADHNRHDVVEVLAGAAVAYLIIDSLNNDDRYDRRHAHHYAHDRHSKRHHHKQRHHGKRHHDRHYKGWDHARYKKHHAKHKRQHKRYGYKDRSYRRYSR